MSELEGTTHPYDSFHAISLWNPWATLIALGEKKIETRHWYVKFRGTIAIYATKTFPPEARQALMGKDFQEALKTDRYDFSTPKLLPRAAIVGLARVKDCRWIYDPFGESISNLSGWDVPQGGDFYGAPEHSFGWYEQGRTMTYFDGAVWFNNPVPVVATSQSPIWKVPPHVGREIIKELLATPRENFTGDAIPIPPYMPGSAMTGLSEKMQRELFP